MTLRPFGFDLAKVWRTHVERYERAAGVPSARLGADGSQHGGVDL
ncbi:hypothetical protein [Dactylosporangium sp. CS-033363]